MPAIRALIMKITAGVGAGRNRPSRCFTDEETAAPSIFLDRRSARPGFRELPAQGRTYRRGDRACPRRRAKRRATLFLVVTPDHDKPTRKASTSTSRPSTA